MASTYLTRTFGSAGNRRTWTLSLWIKRTGIGGQQNFFGSWISSSHYERIMFNNDKIYVSDVESGGTVWQVETDAVYRDTNAWYHLILRHDTTQSTANDRIRLYVNNVQQTFGTNSQPAQNRETAINTAIAHKIGMGYNSEYTDCVMSHVHFCDGYSYAPTEFGETDSTTGEWKIKTSPSVSYGTTGFFILKDGNSVTDQSGNSNNFTVGGGTLTKTEDCPSNVFATLNPLDQAHISTKPTIAYGNTQWTASGNSTSNCSIRGTIGASSGKYYFEVKLLEATNQLIGVDCPDVAGAWYDNTGYMGNHSGFYAILINSTDTIRSVVAGSGGGTDLGTVTNNDIIGCAFDFDNGKFYFSKNGSWLNSGDPTSGSTGTGSFGNLASGLYVPAITNYSYGTASSTAFNFGNGYFGTTAVSSAGTNASGNGIFEYDVPTGYTALSTKGLNL